MPPDVSAGTAADIPSLVTRLLCLSYEGLLLTAVWFAATLAFLAVSQVAALGISRPAFQIYLVLVGAVYFLPQWRRGATLPLKTWHIRLVSRQGGAVSLKQAVLRYIFALLSWSLLGAGYLWAVVDCDRQFLHDRLAGTRLIRHPDPAPEAATGAPGHE